MTTISIHACGDISEDDALAQLAALGFHGGVSDRVGKEEDLHWHDFDAVAWVLAGEAAIELADGTVITAGPGIRVQLPRGTVHKDVPGTSYRGVLGFSVRPSEMTLPIDRPVDQLPV